MRILFLPTLLMSSSYAICATKDDCNKGNCINNICKCKKGWIGDVPNFTYNFEKLRSAGWEPKITSDEAISRTAAWLKENLS